MSMVSAGLWSAPCGDGSTPRRYIVADVFTDTPLQGNQLAVFTDGRGLPAGQMQRAARELNLSETVFFLPPEQDGDLRIRIFTPASELPFAGHPVLGSAFLAGELLLHLAEHDRAVLPRQRDRDHPDAGLQLDDRSVGRLAEDERGPEHRMAGERQLRGRREDPRAGIGTVGGRVQEDGLGQVELARGPLHHLIAQPRPVGEDRDLVAPQRRVG